MMTARAFCSFKDSFKKIAYSDVFDIIGYIYLLKTKNYEFSIVL